MAVYFVQAGEDGPVKIGFAKDARSRLSKMQSDNHETLRLVACYEGTTKDERGLHQIFSCHRVRGEWFSADVLQHLGRVLLTPLEIETPNRGPRKPRTQAQRLRSKQAAINRYADPEYRARRAAASKPGGSEWLLRKAAFERHAAVRREMWPQMYGDAA